MSIRIISMLPTVEQNPVNLCGELRNSELMGKDAALTTGERDQLE